MRYIYVRAAAALSLFVLCMVAMLTLQEHVLFYQEQHSLFLYTAQYFENTVRANGLAGYLASFVIQFYHVPVLGAAVVSALLVAVYLLVGSIIRRLTGWRDLLQLGMVATVVLYFTLDGVDETPRTLMLVLMWLVVIWVLMLFCGRWLPVRQADTRLSLLKVLLPVVLAATYLSSGYWLLIRDYNHSERAMVRAERAVRMHDWDTAIAIADRHLASGRNNKLMLYIRNLSLAHKGQLIDHLFDYPMKFGVEGLAFPWKSDSREAEHGHYVHEATGNLNAAHRWAFEAMAIWGETAPHVLDLARYNIAMGRPLVACKFVNLLDKTLFYRGEAQRLQRQIDGLEAPDVHYAFAGVTEAETRFINMQYPARDLMEILKVDPDNYIARQYVVALLLTSNDLEGLMQLMATDPVKSHTIEEAEYMYSLYPDSTPLDTFGLSVSEDVMSRYERLGEFVRRGDMMAAQREFGKTYWYYLYNHCPYGTAKNNTLDYGQLTLGEAQ